MMLIKFVLLLIPCVTSISRNSTEVEDQWRDFKINFKRTYKTSAEETKRFSIFKENFNFIQDHNKNDTTTFKIEVNREADKNNEDHVELKPHKK